MAHPVKLRKLVLFLLIALGIIAAGTVILIWSSKDALGTAVCLCGVIVAAVGIRQYIRQSFHTFRRDPNFQIKHALTRGDRYYLFMEQYQPLISGQTDEIAVMANTAAALREVFDFFWVGFYLVRNGQLVLGPFQGPVACSSIQYGKGVCGTAWQSRETQVVPNVEDFPGHIACSSLSRSEIVVPVMAGEEVKAVLDIDSDRLRAFNNTDKNFLEKIMGLMAKEIYRQGNPARPATASTEAPAPREEASATDSAVNAGQPEGEPAAPTSEQKSSQAD